MTTDNNESGQATQDPFTPLRELRAKVERDKVFGATEALTLIDQVAASMHALSELPALRSFVRDDNAIATAIGELRREVETLRNEVAALRAKPEMVGSAR